MTSIGSSAFSNCTSLASITLPENSQLTSIGNYAFLGCRSLTSITIPEGVTSIGERAFVSCRSLTAITLPEGVKSIGEGAFSNCTSLTTIMLPKSVKSIGSKTFANCSELTDVYCNAETVPSTKTNAFDGSYIEYATLHVPASAVNEYKNTAPWSGFGKFETTSIAVASITLSASSAALAEGESLTLTATVSPDDAEDKSVSWSSSASNVATVDNAGKVTAIAPGTAIITATANDGSGVSASCEVTVSPAPLPATLPVTLTESDGLLATKSTDSSGREQYEYTSPVYTLEEGINTLYFTFIKGYAPNGAGLLDNTGFPFVALVEFDLYDGEGNEIPLASSNFSTNAQETSEGAISNICDDDRTTFWHSRWSGDAVGDYHRLMVTLPEGCALSEFQFRYVTRDTRQCVPGCIQVGVTPEVAPYEVSGTCGDNLTWTLNSEGNLVIEGTGSMPDFDSYAGAPWSGYGALSNIILPEGVTSIGDRAFSGFTSLTSIVVAEGNKVYDSRGGCNAIIETSSNTLIQGCSTTIIPESVTSIGDGAFYYCSSLTSITLPESVTSIGDYAFYYCSSLTSITIPEGVTSIGGFAFRGCSGLTSITIPEGVTSIGECAFNGCTSLTAITLPEGVTSIGYSAFYGCSRLTSITIPESVTSIGDNAFSGCSSLTSINIPDGLTSIEFYAFQGCSSLTSITISESVTSIDYGAFSGCPELTDVYCHAEKVPFTETEAFYGSNIEYATLHVPASAVNEYKNTAPWSGFGIIVSLDAALTRITLSASSAALAEGESLTLTATVSPDDAEDKSLTWSSSAPNVATVDNAGKVTAIAPGTAIITATANDGSGVSASCEVTVTPVSYIITYLVDGEVYATETLKPGATITVPDAPTKEGHTFSGWSGLPETMPAKDITVSGTFTVNQYRVTFKIDGVVIACYTQDYGSAIVAPEAPEREGYTFSGWGDVAKTVPASDVTYEGSYSVNSYTITYSVDGEVVHSESVTYGTTIVALEEPTKEGHTFSGWSGLPEIMPAKDITVSGTFAVNKYLVTFTIDDVVIASDSLEYGTPIVPPTMPEREGYTFSGWDDVAETVPAADVTYNASYTANLYNVYYFVGATLVHTVKVAYGEPIPEYIYEPAEEGYTFLGWIGETYASMPAHDVTYTANIDNGIGTLTIDCSQLNIYDLTGRKVTDTENLKGGIYIINGKKVVIND